MNLHAPKGIDVENWFIECYRKHKGHPLKILIGLYKGNYNKFFLAVLFFFIKHAPVWVRLILSMILQAVRQILYRILLFRQ